MATNVDATLKGVKELGREVTQFQMRLDDVKSQVEKLRQERESLEKDIKQIRAVAEQEISQKLFKARQEASKVEEDKKILAGQRTDLESAIHDFQKEKTAFEREKSDVVAMKQSFVEKEARVGQFIRMIRQQAEAL